MAEFIGNRYSLVVNSVDLSDRVVSMSHTRSQEIKEWIANNTAGANPIRRRLVSVQDLTLSVTFKDDFAASGANSVHNTLEALMGNAGFTVTWSYLTATESATNPEYTATMIYGSFQTGGPVGEVLEKQVEFMLASGSVTVDIT